MNFQKIEQLTVHTTREASCIPRITLRECTFCLGLTYVKRRYESYGSKPFGPGQTILRRISYVALPCCRLLRLWLQR